jgi:hypothetical protein
MEENVRKKLKRLAILLVWLVLLQGSLLNDRVVAQDQKHLKHQHNGHHNAHHGGVLNVIGKCEIGHLEVRIEDDFLEAWFVGGGTDTHRAVPIKAEEVVLAVTLPDGGERTLILKAEPMKLAGEKHGHCSRFLAHADWLKKVEKFEAHGEIVFKGIRRLLLIRYPEGYDPGHGKE